MNRTITILLAAGIGLAAITPTFAATNDLPGILADDGHKAVDKRGRSKPRIPGGSGCDDPGDILEHPECRG